MKLKYCELVVRAKNRSLRINPQSTLSLKKYQEVFQKTASVFFCESTTHQQGGLDAAKHRSVCLAVNWWSVLPMLKIFHPQWQIQRCRAAPGTAHLSPATPVRPGPVPWPSLLPWTRVADSNAGLLVSWIMPLVSQKDLLVIIPACEPDNRDLSWILLNMFRGREWKSWWVY